MLSNFISKKPIGDLLAQDDTLAVISYTQSAGKNVTPLKLALMQEELDELDTVEVWRTNSPIIESGTSDNCTWRRSEDYLFVATTLPCDRTTSLQAISEQAYSKILGIINASDHTQLLRFWNIIPRINVGEGDTESYKQFCNGRLAAFNTFDIDENDYPSASAVGQLESGITIYAIASKFSPNHIGNPRQIDAFHYPRQYGPSSPSFARATLVSVDKYGQSKLLFISGTASILGHDSVHIGDLVGQLHTTNDNILYVLKEANFKRSDIESIRVYLRNAADFTQTKGIIENWYPNTNISITHADICRANLLVEIECFCRSSISN